MATKTQVSIGAQKVIQSTKNLALGIVGPKQNRTKLGIS